MKIQLMSMESNVNWNISQHIFRKIFFILLAILSTTRLYANDDPWLQSYQLEAQGKYVEAANVIQPFITNTVKSEFALLRIAWLNYLAKNYNSAIDRYQDAISFNPNSFDARLGVMLPLMAQSRWREAAVYAEQVLSTAPWQYYAHVRLMACEAAQLQWEKLEKHAKTVSERYPSDADSLVFLARAQANLNKTEAAKNAYQKVLEIFPENIEALRFLVSNK